MATSGELRGRVAAGCPLGAAGGNGFGRVRKVSWEPGPALRSRTAFGAEMNMPPETPSLLEAASLPHTSRDVALKETSYMSELENNCLGSDRLVFKSKRCCLRAPYGK